MTKKQAEKSVLRHFSGGLKVDEKKIKAVFPLARYPNVWLIEVWVRKKTEELHFVFFVGKKNKMRLLIVQLKEGDSLELRDVAIETEQGGEALVFMTRRFSKEEVVAFTGSLSGADTEAGERWSIPVAALGI